MKIKTFIPHFITLLNLFSGILSILFLMQDKLVLASWMIFIAAVFDFFDGFAARFLKVQSKLGVQLDSLADVVSFGIAPGFILYHLILQSHGRQIIELAGLDLIPLIALIFPLFAAFRLAKFNIDERQTNSFIGLPTPAASLLIASLPLIKAQLYESQSLTYMVFTNTYFYIGLAIILSLLMISELPLMALKFKSFGLKGNEIRYLLIVISIGLLLGLQFLGIPFVILTYLFLSLVIFLTDL